MIVFGTSESATANVTVQRGKSDAGKILCYIEFFCPTVKVYLVKFVCFQRANSVLCLKLILWEQERQQWGFPKLLDFSFLRLLSPVHFGLLPKEGYKIKS